MNPIEIVWDYISRAIFLRNKVSKNHQQLIIYCRPTGREELNIEITNNLKVAFPRRDGALIGSRGGKIRH